MKTKEKWRWYYKLPGNFHALGPTTGEYSSEREVRKMLRVIFFPKKKRLPKGIEVWKA